MTLHEWRTELGTRLLASGLPLYYVRRTAREMTDHFEELLAETTESDEAQRVLGSPAEEELAETRRLLYARYGMLVGGEFLNFGPTTGLQIGNFGEVIGAIGGHLAARIETEPEARRRSVPQEDAYQVVRGNW